MVKGDGPNPAEEMLFRLSLEHDFQNDLIEARDSLDIRSEGLSTEEDRLDWLKKHVDRSIDLLGIEFHLQKKHGIPMAFRPLLTDYILCGKPMQKNISKPPAVLIDKYAHRKDDARRSNMEDFYIEFAEPFVKLFIFGGRTKTEVLHFIKQNWDEIEALLAEQGAKPRNAGSRVRKVVYKKRDQLIRVLWGKPNKVLRQEIIDLGGDVPDRRSRYFKDALVRELLQRKHGIRVSEGYVRKICGGGYLSTRKSRQ